MAQVKFTKVVAGPEVTYTVTVDGKRLAARPQRTDIAEDEKPFKWKDRNWKHALTYEEGGKALLYGFASDAAHLERLKAKAAAEKRAGLQVTPLA